MGECKVGGGGGMLQQKKTSKMERVVSNVDCGLWIVNDANNVTTPLQGFLIKGKFQIRLTDSDAPNLSYSRFQPSLRFVSLFS